MKAKFICCLIAAIFLAVSLSACSEKQGAGAIIGGFVGGLAGGMIDHKNRARGAAIGAAIGASLGVAAGSISERAAKDAARENQTVVYTEKKQDGKIVVAEATPVGQGKAKNCKRIHNKVIEDGQVIADNVQEVCH